MKHDRYNLNSSRFIWMKDILLYQKDIDILYQKERYIIYIKKKKIQ